MAATPGRAIVDRIFAPHTATYAPLHLPGPLITCLVVCCLPKHHMEVAVSSLLERGQKANRPDNVILEPYRMQTKKKEKSPKRKISIQSMDLVATIDGLEIQRTS